MGEWMGSVFSERHDLQKGYKSSDDDTSTKRKKIIYILTTILFITIISMIYLYTPTPETAEPDIKMVSGTEYISGELGQIIVRLADNMGNPIENADCTVTLLHPDKSFFFIDRAMNKTTIAGNYFVAFTTPTTEGIYEEHIICNITHNDVKRTLYISSSFHVSPGLNLIVEMSRSQREQFENLIEQINITNERINSLEENINTSIDSIEANINNTIRSKFIELSQKFATTATAMSEIFE